MQYGEYGTLHLKIEYYYRRLSPLHACLQQPVRGCRFSSGGTGTTSRRPRTVAELYLPTIVNVVECAKRLGMMLWEEVARCVGIGRAGVIGGRLSGAGPGKAAAPVSPSARSRPRIW